MCSVFVMLHPSIYLSIYLFIHLPSCLSIYLSIHLPNLVYRCVYLRTPNSLSHTSSPSTLLISPPSFSFSTLYFTSFSYLSYSIILPSPSNCDCIYTNHTGSPFRSSAPSGNTHCIIQEGITCCHTDDWLDACM